MVSGCRYRTNVLESKPKAACIKTHHFNWFYLKNLRWILKLLIVQMRFKSE